MPPIERPENPHDILAAEEFALPAVDPELRHRPVALPDDPSGIAEPHDILAAEEFAMPAPSSHASVASPTASGGEGRGLGLIAALLGLLLVLRRLRRR